MPAMSSSLLAFALVADEYERTGDPILGMKPLFSPLLSGKAGSEFDAVAFSQEFTEMYGLHMQPFVARALADRLVTIGLLSSSHDREKGTLYHVEDFEWEAERVTEEEIDEVTTLFSIWGRAQADKVGRSFSKELLQRSILERLSRPEFASIFSNDSDSKNRAMRSKLGVGAPSLTSKDEEYLDFLVASFLLQAARDAPDVFASIERIALGALLADAVAGFAVPAEPSTSGDPLRVILDSPLILDLLDLNSRQQKEYALAFLGALKDHGLRVAVFEHSIEEAKIAIQTILDMHRRGVAYGPMAHRFKVDSGHTAYASVVRNSLKSRVENLGISVLRVEIYEEARFKRFFPDSRVDEVRNAIGDLHENLEARILDAKSVAAVARLKGQKADSASVFQSGSIFITRNSVLCKRVNGVLSRGRGDPHPRFVIATDGQFAGVLWFARGAVAHETSKRRLIANCSAAVLPRRDLVARMSSLMESWDENLKREFSALMTDERASLFPMRVTGGYLENVTEATLHKIMEGIRAEISEDADRRARDVERQLALVKQDASVAISQSKAAVLDLQELIASSDAHRDSERARFDAQFAQLSMDLERSNDSKKALELQGNLARKDMDDQISALETEMADRRELIVYTIGVLSSIAAIVVLVLAFFFPLFGGVWVNIGLFFVSLASVFLVRSALRKICDWMAQWFTRRDSKEVQRLKALRDKL